MDREEAVRAAFHVFAMLLGLSLHASVAQAADEPAGGQPVVREGVPLKVANRQIIILRGPIGGSPPGSARPTP